MLYAEDRVDIIYHNARYNVPEDSNFRTVFLQDPVLLHPYDCQLHPPPHPTPFGSLACNIELMTEGPIP
jgi:hypothetical protein